MNWLLELLPHVGHAAAILFGGLLIAVGLALLVGRFMRVGMQ